MILLSTAYAPPVQYFCKMLRTNSVQIEACEHYIKQTYRSRCHIATDQGIQSLNIPVASGASSNCPIRDVRISEHGNWRHVHRQALRTAYGSSAFFEYLAPEIFPHFDKGQAFLFDFNYELLQTLLRLLSIDVELSLTSSFEEPMPLLSTSPKASPLQDYRLSIRPKNPPIDPAFHPIPYYQTNAAIHGFLPNLSILDLLFECGPEAPLILLKSSSMQ